MRGIDTWAPAGNGAVFSSEDETSGAGFGPVAHHKSAGRVGNGTCRSSRLRTVRGRRNDYSQPLLGAGAVVERGLSGSVVADPPRTRRRTRKTPRINEV